MTKRQHTIKTNYLMRAQAVQEAYQSVRVEGQPDSYIWRTHIYPKFFISLRTFYRYLGIVPQKELRAIGEQGRLFS